MNYLNPNFNKLKREDFLKAWNREYPNTLGWTFVGRLEFNDNQVNLVRNGKIVKRITFGTELHWINKNLKSQNWAPEVVLHSGDWVEIDGVVGVDGILEVLKIHLLSPNQTQQNNSHNLKNGVREWNQFLNKVQDWFQLKGFEHLKTPTLVACPGTEPFLEPFATEFIYGSTRRKYFLPTSPEIHLKKCLAKGWDQIYEIKTCFRNGEISAIHHPEFYMLEWYRAFSTLAKLQEDVRELVNYIHPKKKSLEPWVRLSVADLFQKYLDFNLRPQSSESDLIKVAQQHKVEVDESMDFDEIFFRLFLEKIEPRLHELGSLFLHSYPPSQAALARLTSDGWGDRFEVYINGIEIANAFNELNDPVIQRERSNEDLDKKLKYGKTPISLDEEFFKSLESGMPPSCGIALGLERLFMVTHEYKDINEFSLFPFEILV